MIQVAIRYDDSSGYRYVFTSRDDGETWTLTDATGQVVKIDGHLEVSLAEVVTDADAWSNDVSD